MYIDKTDLEKQIQEDLLAGLDFTGDDTIIITACAQAVGQLKSYLASRYDIATELANTSTDREDLLLMIAKDLAIYHIWSYNDASNIPKARHDRYTAAMAYLKDAEAGTATVNISAAVIAYSPIVGGSNLKRSNYY